MVSTSTLITVIITFLITSILPLVVWVIYGLKNKGKGAFTAWLLGATGFFIMQVIIRVPILNMLSLTAGFQSFVAKHYVLYCLVVAFTAGLFELIGRYVVAKIMAKNLTYERSFAAGLGHGGIEAMIIIGMTYLNNLLYIGMINSGTFDGIVEQTAALGVDTTSLVAVKDALINTNSAVFLLAGYERILTMILHVALSLMVCYFVSKKQDLKGILICLACHWMVDFIAPLVNGMATEYMGNMLSQTTAYIIVYVFLTAVAVVSVVAILNIRKNWKLVDNKNI
ncbi:MAG: YhfC family intramembrane metalloprotease [Lachnospiraceae bacterium]|nr:YhfC family intramembrane metalloprotease [Lachnospiraceae bacterium]